MHYDTGTTAKALGPLFSNGVVQKLVILGVVICLGSVRSPSCETSYGILGGIHLNHQAVKCPQVCNTRHVRRYGDMWHVPIHSNIDERTRFRHFEGYNAAVLRIDHILRCLLYATHVDNLPA